jgi:hypothetical protein
MARKRNPADAAVEYFQTADVEAAAAILDVCTGIVKRRRARPGGEPARARRSSRTAAASTSSAAPGAGDELPLDGARDRE